MPSVDGNAKRETSGLGGSILITSAPRSCNVLAQRGPASTREKSTTRSPLSGPLILAPRKLGEAGTVLAERCQSGFKVFRGPDRRLDPLHGFVRRGDALVDGDVYKLLGGRMCQRRPLSELLGNRHRRRFQRFLGHGEIDQPPFFERWRVIAAVP